MKTTLAVAAMVLGAVGCSSEVDHPSAPTSQAARPQDEAIQNVKEIAAAAKAVLDADPARWGCSWARTVPAGMPPAGGSYNASCAFDGDDGWDCLGWRPSQATLRYQYSFMHGLGLVTNNPDRSDVRGFEAAAFGDLD